MASDYLFGILDLWLLITYLVSSNFSNYCQLKFATLETGNQKTKIEDAK
jgi:hypothetical protein